MTRPATFTQSDVTKVLKAARAAGLPVASVEIDRTGKIVANFGGPADAVPAGGNEWDEVLDRAQDNRTTKERL